MTAAVCRWCSNTLPAQDAKVCTACNMSQNVVYERARQTITVATLLGFVTSALLFVWQPMLDGYHRLFTTPSLTVTAFMTERDGLLRNTGKLPIFASHIEIVPVDASRRAVVSIAQELAPGETISIDTRGLYAQRVEKSDTLEPWIFSVAAPDPVFAMIGEDSRVIPVYAARDDYQLKAQIAHAEQKQAARSNGGRAVGLPTKVNIKDATCEVHFSTKAQGAERSAFDCVMLLASKGSLTGLFPIREVPPAAGAGDGPAKSDGDD
ncbi:hypothetical protein ANTHELSMS3_01610 [Antarctobacter heliothermus]|uniref:Uncharacterized protein n=1 Tax=Antarctobacter heliothermus TaxID=74033 RepID=A0A222E277_9RHOB|nr:hypothetical protein [Antarctobacter heliothermus]ASP20305.1 hypothetical protein ANTHELSMS3_01610 [Antarctobacter heliothermus]